MSRLSLGIAGALLFTGFLFINAPARLLQLFLPEGQIIMQGFAGSLWRGSASRALVATGGSTYLHLGSVSWTLKPWSLLLLAPSLDVRSEWGDQTVSGLVTLRGAGKIGLRDFEANASADLVRQFAPVALTGSLSARFDRLLLEDNLPVAGEGQLVWQNAGWQSPQGPLGLGGYALEFSQAEDAPLLAEIITITGPVQAAGNLQLDGRNYAVDITVQGERGLEEQLERALSLLATPVDDGYRLQLEGEF